MSLKYGVVELKTKARKFRRSTLTVLMVTKIFEECSNFYEDLINANVAPEMARMVPTLKV